MSLDDQSQLVAGDLPFAKLKWQKFLPFGNTYRSYKAFKALLTNFLDPNDKNRVSLIYHRNFSHLQMANVLLFQMANAFDMIEKTSSRFLTMSIALAVLEITLMMSQTFFLKKCKIVTSEIKGITLMMSQTFF